MIDGAVCKEAPLQFNARHVDKKFEIDCCLTAFDSNMREQSVQNEYNLIAVISFKK